MASRQAIQGCRSRTSCPQSKQGSISRHPLYLLSFGVTWPPPCPRTALAFPAPPLPGQHFYKSILDVEVDSELYVCWDIMLLQFCGELFYAPLPPEYESKMKPSRAQLSDLTSG